MPARGPGRSTGTDNRSSGRRRDGTTSCSFFISRSSSSTSTNGSLTCRRCRGRRRRPGARGTSGSGPRLRCRSGRPRESSPARRARTRRARRFPARRRPPRRPRRRLGGLAGGQALDPLEHGGQFFVGVSVVVIRLGSRDRCPRVRPLPLAAVSGKACQQVVVHRISHRVRDLGICRPLPLRSRSGLETVFSTSLAFPRRAGQTNRRDGIAE